MLKTATRVIFGFVLACLTAGIATVLFVITPSDLFSVAAEAFPEKLGQALTWGLLAATHSAIFAAVFVLIAAAVAEWLGFRSPYYYLLAGAVIALLGFYAQYASEIAGQATIFNAYAAMAFLTAGLLGGFVYWIAAGRFAGAATRPDVEFEPEVGRCWKTRDAFGTALQRRRNEDQDHPGSGEGQSPAACGFAAVDRQETERKALALAMAIAALQHKRYRFCASHPESAFCSTPIFKAASRATPPWHSSRAPKLCSRRRGLGKTPFKLR